MRDVERLRYATFKDVVGAEINREVIERQVNAARMAVEWRRLASVCVRWVGQA